MPWVLITFVRIDRIVSDPAEAIGLGPGTYFVQVGGYTDALYRLEATGPLAGGPSPGPAELTPNNNPDITTAFGPLLGGKLYAGTIDTSSEEDWFYFNTAGPGGFDVAITGIADSSSVWAALTDASGEGLSSTGTVNPNRVQHLRYTGSGAARYALQIEGYTEGRYQLRIDPAWLITTAAPPPVAPAPAPAPAPPAQRRTAAPNVKPACRKARGARAKAKRRVAVGRRKLRAVKSKRRSATTRRAWRSAGKAQRKWRRVVKKRKVAMRKANRRAKARCA